MKFYLCRIDGKRRLLTRMAEAERADPKHRKIEVPTDQERLAKFIEGLFELIDRRPGADVPEREESTSETGVGTTNLPVREQTYAETTIKIDEAWEALPLARKLHFAAMAMEDAREILR